MEITMTIPDDVAAEIQNGTSLPLSRRLLELAALEAYKSGLLTSFQVQKLLGFDNRNINRPPVCTVIQTIDSQLSSHVM